MGDYSSRPPSALRRSPRHSTMRLHSSTSPSQRHPRQHAVSKYTPRQTKGARSSESSSITVCDMQTGPMTPPTTGRHRSMQRAIPTIKRRKYAKTNNPTTPDQAVRDHGFETYGATPVCNEVRIFPLRAILDDRVKRRIRRNGLSEEMNTIFDERKQRAKKNFEEMQRLRDQVVAKELENDMLREQSSLLQDTSRILELEREISELRQGLHSQSFNKLDDGDWDMAAADGFTDGGSVSDLDDRFRDDTTLEIESASSPAYEKEKLYTDTLAAFTPPNTSPTRTASSDGPCLNLPAPRCDMALREKSECADQAPLEAEMMQLRQELSSLQETLETNGNLDSQLTAKMASTKTANTAADVDPDLQLQTDIMIQTLAEKTTALANLTSLVSTLGSPISGASEIVSTLRHAFCSARQELEQIFPNEMPLPVPVEGIVVLGTMLQHLRESAAQIKSYEGLVEEHCYREQHLREQLSDRTNAMGAVSSKLREKDDRIFRLEADLEQSEVTIDGYRQCANDSTDAVEQHRAEMAEIRVSLGAMVAEAADLQAQLAQVQTENEVEMIALKSTYDGELILRDAKLLELQSEITVLKEALTLARDSFSTLQVENDRMKGDADRDKKVARDTVALLRTQLLQSLQTSEAFLA